MSRLCSRFERLTTAVFGGRWCFARLEVDQSQQYGQAKGKLRKSRPNGWLCMSLSSNLDVGRLWNLAYFGRLLLQIGSLANVSIIKLRRSKYLRGCGALRAHLR